MKEIGGFFGLELTRNKEYHSSAIKLNSARNAFLYALRTYKPNKIYIPFYICDSIVEIVIKEKIEFEFYHINIDLEPILNLRKIGRADFVLYVNYFGIKDNFCSKLSQKHENIIVDNAQAFYSKPCGTVCTIYSPRKFFGVADGGYLYSTRILDQKLKRDYSFDGCEHLLKRIDADAQASYSLFKNHEELIAEKMLKRMSRLSQYILESIDYERSKLAREINFQILHKELGCFNKLNLPEHELNGPMVYPFLSKNGGLKKFLIDNKIYVATYWKEVDSRVNKKSIENMLTSNLIALPIDQRYSHKDMQIIIDKILNYPNLDKL